MKSSGTSAPRAIESCRICGSTDLAPVLDLGEHMLTGVFPEDRDTEISSGPLCLVKCSGPGSCGLLQLQHTYDFVEMYGDNYGYRSGLNTTMIRHLHGKVARIEALIDLRPGDLVIDIGSNDGTTLSAYATAGLDLLGIDPTATKFLKYYPAHVNVLVELFSKASLSRARPGALARVITSFAMLYDLEAPLQFMQDMHDILAPDGIWMFEQSYMPTMLKMNSLDTVCHEHLEYYGLQQIVWMTSRVGFKIIELSFNDTNGGSFSVTVAKTDAPYPVSADVEKAIAGEVSAGLNGLEPYRRFAEHAEVARRDLLDFMERAREQGKIVAALGASTKGNTMLQYCGLGPGDIKAVGDVNPEKFGRLTPGTWIPILPEEEVLAMRPDYLLVLPWHFHRFFCESPQLRGFNLVFPLPKLWIRAAEVR